MTLTFMCFLLFFGDPAPTPILPKYSPSYDRTSRDIGPLPGSSAPNRDSQTFKRVYSRPAELRLLVRTNCDTKPSAKELLERARKLTTAGGQIVQIDWEPIVGDQVTYWAVASGNRQISEIELVVEEGKYKPGAKKTRPEELWETSRIRQGSTPCFSVSQLKTDALALGVANFLNQFSVELARRATTEQDEP